MTRSDFELFLLGGIGLCGLLALISLARIRSKSLSAWFQAGGYSALGATLLLQRNDAPQPLVIAGFVLVGLMLFADIAYRSARDAGGKRP